MKSIVATGRTANRQFERNAGVAPQKVCRNFGVSLPQESSGTQLSQR